MNSYSTVLLRIVSETVIKGEVKRGGGTKGSIGVPWALSLAFINKC
jgi:hypothetical protein